MRPRRADGFAPIEDYAALGDGRTVALVAADGCIDWWPVSRMDARPSFTRILDDGCGGTIALHPTESFEVTRRYVGDSSVLESLVTTDSGSARITDVIPLGRSGLLSWSQLVRRVEGVDGSVAFDWSVSPGNRFFASEPTADEADGVVLIHNGDDLLAVQSWDLGDTTVDGGSVSGRFTTAPGSCGVLSISAGADSPVVVPERDGCLAGIALTTSRWGEWADAIRYDGPWRDAVRRSAMALKLLQFAPTGAIAAAPTTSLPERLGGDKNWDYRFMWIRDAAFTVDALLNLALHEEAHAAVQWMLGVLRQDSPNLKVFYTLEGGEPDGETDFDLAGYRGSRPVRAGNQASGQSQLGTFGDLFDMMWLYVRDGHRLDPVSSGLLNDLADRCCDVWEQKDAGIWELTDDEHYTVSKIGCWTALDRAAQLAGAGQLDAGKARRWCAERDRIARWVNENCWSESKKSYTAYAGTEDLDASTLLAARTGFDQGERIAGTIAAIRTELCEGPLVYRYTTARGDEGAFLACTFWLVNALAVTGRRDEARDLMDEAVALANDVGLLAEEMDPATRAMLGNFPQGLSHLALINAAVAYAAAT